jgi:hypothetical protein
MQAIRGAVELGKRLLGSSAWLTPLRFLYRNVGDVFLLSVAKPVTEHLPLSEESLEEELELPLDEFVSRPTLLLQTVLDHNHASYSHDLLTAARLQQRREQRERAGSL